MYIWPHMVDGSTIGEIRRVTKVGGGKDDLPCYTDDGHGFSAGIPEFKKPLPPFGLDSIKDFDSDIFVVEGQKVQAALESLGFQVITSVLGAFNAGSTDWKRVQGARRYILVPDNDQPGERYMSDVCGLLQPSDGEILIARFADLEKKDDLVDWLQLQPELLDWNGYDPLTAHPDRDLLADRLRNEVAKRVSPVPDAWRCLWPEPEPIESRLKPVDQFDIEMLPSGLRAWIQDAAYRMEVPAEYVAVGAIVSAGAAIGTRAAIKPRACDDWKVVPNVWGCVIGPPGDGKSPALREALFALEGLEADASKSAEASQKTYEAKLAAYSAREKAIKDEMNQAAKSKGGGEDMTILEERLCELTAPDRPNAERFIANDTTVEALIDLLSVNPRGLLMMQDELSALMSTFDKKGHETDRSFMLQCWTGDGKHRHDRRTGGTKIVEKLCLSVLGGIQEDLLRTYLSVIAKGQNDGFIQRFQLMVFPDQRQASTEIVDAFPDTEARFMALSIFRDLATANLGEYGGSLEDGRWIFKFSADAQGIYRDWLGELNQKITKQEHPMLREHLSKYRSLMPSLALIFHLMNCIQNGVHEPVSAEAATLAAVWCGFLESHAARVYGLLKPRDQAAAAVLADKINRGLLGGKFTVRQLTHKNWPALSYADSAKAAADQLVEAGWLSVEVKKTRGRPTQEYIVNPKLLAKAANTLAA